MIKLQTKIDEFRQLIKLADTDKDLYMIEKIADSCLSPLSYAETGIVLSMVREARFNENRAQRRINRHSSDADLLRRSRICRVCLMSDLKYQKGEWYHVQEDGTFKPVDYEKEVKEYYKKWRDRYGNQTRNRH